MTPGSRRVARCAAAAALTGAVVACSSATAEQSARRPRDRTARHTAVAPTTPTTGVPIPDAPRYVPVAPVLTVAAPARLEIPAIDVSTSLVPLGLAPDGSMEVPADFARAGWYTDGPAPGESGPAVIAGHVDSARGPAVFLDLGDLHRGDEVRVVRVDGSVARFAVDRVERFEKQAFPTETVFGPTELPELRLVTCGGDFDFEHRTYLDNVVVFARPA